MQVCPLACSPKTVSPRNECVCKTLITEYLAAYSIHKLPVIHVYVHIQHLLALLPVNIITQMHQTVYPSLLQYVVCHVNTAPTQADMNGIFDRDVEI